jgi:hypothetical protein
VNRVSVGHPYRLTEFGSDHELFQVLKAAGHDLEVVKMGPVAMR